MATACKAIISPSYRIRLGILTAMFVFWFAYCMYDGYVAYPRQREIARAYETFRVEGRLEQWDAYAAQHGWPDDNDGPPGKDHSESDIRTQFIMGYGVLPLALIFGVAFFRSSGRWIELNDDSLSASSGQQVKLDDIARLDKLRWRSKGIAVAHYEDGAKSCKIVLDNFKFSPREISEMVKEVESRLSPDQITSPPTPPAAKSTTQG